MAMNLLATEIIQGKRLRDTEDLSFFIDCDLNDLRSGADRIRAHFRGDSVDLCSIINGRSGRCSEDCKYCAQSAHHQTSCNVHDFLDEDTIVSAALCNEKEGVHRFSIVTSGRTLSESDFQKAVHAYERMHRECRIALCASHGFLTDNQFQQLLDAGVTHYHCNIETSRNYFSQICTTHTYDEKLDNIRRAQNTGLEVCSGGIIGMGESWQDRIDMALTLSALHILSIPVNALMPIPGTPLQDMPVLTADDILRTIAIFRYINPEADIRLAAGRALLDNNGADAFDGGASATITGNMLTTTGSTIQSDKDMLTALGRNITPD